MVDTEIREILATCTPDGKAVLRIGEREQVVGRRTEVGGLDSTHYCPIELIGQSLAA